LELAALEHALQQARDGHGGLFAVVGEPGVGKSRLYREFTQSAQASGCLVLEAMSVSFGKATPWLPVIDLLKRYFRLEPGDSPRITRERVTGKLLSLGRELESVLASLLWLVDAAVDDAAWNRLGPAERRRQLLAGIQTLLWRESEVQPLVVVFEDLHWIDDETQALLDSLLETLSNRRVLLLVNYRAGYSHSWGRTACHQEFRIDPLREKDVDEILDAILGTDPSQASLRPLLIERTEGNPFFLEESVRTLVETGALTGQRGSYRLVRAPSALRIPPTVQAILATRIDRLAPEEKRVLQTAAIIGRDVALDLLQAVVEQTEEELQAILARLQATDFLYESRLFPDVEYTFRHALTQEAAYQGLLHEQCRILHAKVVEAIEHIYSSRLEEHAERLAHHATQGETWSSAVRYCRLSGKRAIARSANRYGASYLKQAIEALAHLPERTETLEEAIDIRFELRGALNALDEMVEVHKYLSEAADLAGKLNDRRRQALVAALMTQSLDMLGDHEMAAESARRALEIGGPLGDVAIETVAHYMMSQSLWHLGNLRDATLALKRCLRALPEDPGYMPFGMVTFPSVVVHAALTSRLAELGEFPEAAKHAAVSLERADRLNHAYTTVFARLSVGYFHARSGDTDSAIPHLERAVELCRTAEIRRQVVPCASVLCYSYALSGRIGEAQMLLDRTVEGLVGGWGGTATWLPWLAEGAMLASRNVEATQIIERALSISLSRHEQACQAFAKRLLGDLGLSNGSLDADAIGRHYIEALALAQNLSLRPLQAQCHLGLSRLHRRAGERERAREHHSIATAQFREMDMRRWLHLANAEL
jgi:tetratricopeptide (TPR) repeat protein